jgi:hypothetical protein
MPKYVIEREIPGIGNATPAELKGISQRSFAVVRKLGPDISWLHSYVTGDKMYCIYQAANADIVREHARGGNFPANVVAEVKSIFDVATGEG